MANCNVADTEILDSDERCSIILFFTGLQHSELSPCSEVKSCIKWTYSLLEKKPIVLNIKEMGGKSVSAITQ